MKKSSSEPGHSALLPQDIDKLRNEFSAKEELDGPGGAITAHEAFELAVEIITSFDEDARLTKIESCGRLESNGRCQGWTFTFVLPNRWGHARFVFSCTGQDESVTVTLHPYAAAGSAMDRMLQEGQEGFVQQQWDILMGREPSLSHRFLDSSEVLQRWAGSGKRVDFNLGPVLQAITPPLGKPRWELLENPNSKKSLYNHPIE